jgi:hypothetical protein
MTEAITTQGIQEFLDKYKQAKGFNSKELRLTIQEADRLSSGIAHILSRHQQLADRVIELQEKLLNPEDIVISGGNFS